MFLSRMGVFEQIDWVVTESMIFEEIGLIGAFLRELGRL